MSHKIYCYKIYMEASMYNNYYPNSGMRLVPPCCPYMMYKSSSQIDPMYRIMVKDAYDDDEIFEIAAQQNIDIGKYNISQFKLGLETEIKLAKLYLKGNLNLEFLLTLGKMVAANLDEIPDYYSRLLKMKLDAGVSVGYRY